MVREILRIEEIVGEEGTDVPMYRKSMLVLLVLVLAALGGMAYGYETKDAVQPLDTGTRAEEVQIVVYVTGAVNKPGVVSLAEGARVADAVNACGGLLPTADAEKVNMAQAPKDGQQIRVPEKQTAGAPAASSTGKTASGTAKQGTAEGDLVNLNTADEKALDTLPGIGPAMAKRIIEYRETEGGFQSVEDLKKVKGIGEAKFEKMKDRVCI